MVHRFRELPVIERINRARHMHDDERGLVLVFVVVMMAVLMSVLALVVDIGNARQQRRQAQTAADSAALAAAEVIETYGPGFAGSEGQWTNVVSDVKGYAKQNFGVKSADWVGCSDSSAYAFRPDVGNGNTCISADFSAWPVPLEGDPINTVNRVRVRLPQRSIQTFFGAFVGQDTLSTGAHAVAAITRTTSTITTSVDVTTPGGPCALCVLADTGLSLDGQNGDVTITGGGVVVNSVGTPTGAAASLSPNGHVTLNVADDNTIGGPGAPSKFTGTGWSPVPGLKDPVADPLAAVPPCGTESTCPTAIRTDSTSTLQPGIYSRIRGSHTLSPGIYVLTGDITLNGNDLLQGDGVMLYMACSNYPQPCAAGETGAGIKATGNGALRLTAPTAAQCAAETPPGGGVCPYVGLMIFADRENVATQTFRGNGSNESGPDSGSSGTIYMRSGTLDLRGNGYALASMIIVNKFSMVGNPSAVSIAYDLDKNFYVETHHSETSTSTVYSYDANGLVE